MLLQNLAGEIYARLINVVLQCCNVFNYHVQCLRWFFPAVDFIRLFVTSRARKAVRVVLLLWKYCASHLRIYMPLIFYIEFINLKLTCALAQKPFSRNFKNLQLRILPARRLLLALKLLITSGMFLNLYLIFFYWLSKMKRNLEQKFSSFS